MLTCHIKLLLVKICSKKLSKRRRLPRCLQNRKARTSSCNQMEGKCIQVQSGLVRKEIHQTPSVANLAVTEHSRLGSHRAQLANKNECRKNGICQTICHSTVLGIADLPPKLSEDKECQGKHNCRLARAYRWRNH